MQQIKFILCFSILTVLACSSNDDESSNSVPISQPETYKVLSLGDSYTIGQSVCDTCRFPEQLKDSLKTKYSSEDTFQLKVIAQTGWTTTNLKIATASENLTNDYDLVTLLIGVNNQFQGKPFSLYETEFPELLQTAIAAAKGDQSNVIVLSIPDYAFTPFGQNNGNPEVISMEIDAYNTFAEAYCIANDITFINITDITREGLNNTDLVASDNLHPSELAYSRFVERLIPIALEKIE